MPRSMNGGARRCSKTQMRWQFVGIGFAICLGMAQLNEDLARRFNAEDEGTERFLVTSIDPTGLDARGAHGACT